MNILIVDDEQISVRGILAGINWDKLHIQYVFTAYNAGEAKKLLRKKSIDLVLCDIEMPQENGLQLCEWIRENYQTVKIVFITGHAKFEYAQRALQLGSFDYLLKPIRYADLEKCILEVRKETSPGDNVIPLEGFNLDDVPTKGASRSSKEIVADVEKYISQHLNEELSVDEIAGHFYLHPDHISRLFKKERGLPLMKYIIHEKMELARHLLSETDLNITEIAKEVGYPNFSHFVMRFRTEYGVSPGKYKKGQDK